MGHLGEKWEFFLSKLMIPEKGMKLWKAQSDTT